MTYRREIDGLRSIAVMAVVLFHFGLSGLQGGFVGVDIFFVISGFLIGGILWGEMTSTGRISLSRFYARRIRRLAPAYVAMAVITFGVAWVVLLPFEFREFGKGLIAATLYLANVLFYRQAGYFDSAAEEKVFLHTWSLSVEEQFYIVLPFVLLLLMRDRRLLIAALVAGFVVSLAANLMMTPTNHAAAFYLFPARAWELLAGVLLAIYGRETGTDWRHNAALSWFGIALVIGAIVLVDPAHGFPGYQAMIPVLGTVLIIINGQHENMVNRLLASRVAVGIGLISYSLYLWHWPVLVLSRYVRDGYSGPIEAFGWICISMALGWVSWRFIERPFRGGSPEVWRVFSGAAIASIVLLAMGAAVYVKNGVPTRFSENVRVHIAASADFLQNFDRCHVPIDGAFAGLEICPVGPKGAPEVLIWGDSHLRAFYEGVAQVAREENVAGLVIWHAGCPPLFGVSKTESAATQEEDAACTQANIRMEKAVTMMPSIKRVMLVGRWAYYAQGHGIGVDFDNKITLTSKGFSQGVGETLQALSENFDKVYVLRQTPEFPLYDSRIVARKMAHASVPDAVNLQAMTNTSPGELRDRTRAAEAPFLAMDGKGVTILDPWPWFCSDGQCSVIQEGQGMYFDNNHVTNTGAIRVRELFVPLFRGRENDG